MRRSNTGRWTCLSACPDNGTSAQPVDSESNAKTNPTRTRALLMDEVYPERAGPASPFPLRLRRFSTR